MNGFYIVTLLSDKLFRYQQSAETWCCSHCSAPLTLSTACLFVQWKADILDNGTKERMMIHTCVFCRMISTVLSSPGVARRVGAAGGGGQENQRSSDVAAVLPQDSVRHHQQKWIWGHQQK